MSTSPATSSQATASQASSDVNITIASNHITTSTSPATSWQATALAAELQSDDGDSDSDSDSDKPNDGEVHTEWTVEQFNKWVYSRPKGYWDGTEARQRKRQDKLLKKLRKERAEEARKERERSESDLKNSNIDKAG